MFEDEAGTCKCGKPGEFEHTCPFDVDINNDSETLCNCCEECQYQCSQDI